MHADGVDLEQENDTTRFPRVHIECYPTPRFLNVMQHGLSKWALDSLDLDVGIANEMFTPAKGKPLTKHVH